MITQGSNTPIILYFDNSIEYIKDISIVLCKEDKFSIDRPDIILKKWSIDDVIFNEIENAIECPLSQEDTIGFDVGRAQLEVKWLDSEGDVWCNEIIRTSIEKRVDRTILMEE